jgi:hypothetical protein
VNYIDPSGHSIFSKLWNAVKKVVMKLREVL